MPLAESPHSQPIASELAAPRFSDPGNTREPKLFSNLNSLPLSLVSSALKSCADAATGSSIFFPVLALCCSPPLTSAFFTVLSQISCRLTVVSVDCPPEGMPVVTIFCDSTTGLLSNKQGGTLSIEQSTCVVGSNPFLSSLAICSSTELDLAGSILLKSALAMLVSISATAP
ncbi:hypothetical protein Leryth_017602 [Lithospermum erythrorhizon]|nr:hypothetical protein Leryth_017602 [Lithospermum erythrorhizon]